MSTVPDPRYVVVALPIPRHDRITTKDENGAVRAWNYRSFRLTEVAPGRTRMEYACSISLKGAIPPFLISVLAVPQQMRVPLSIQRYFQQIRLVSECAAEDGRCVAHLLLALVAERRKSKNLSLSIRTFVNRTAMLRECGFRHMADMLVALMVERHGLTPASVRDGNALTQSTILTRSPSSQKWRHHPPSEVDELASWTEKQAAAIGRTLACSISLALMPAKALQQALLENAVLRTLQARHAWFVPMLEVLLVLNAAGLRKPTFSRNSFVHGMRRLSTRVAPKAVAPAPELPSANSGRDGGVDSEVSPHALTEARLRKGEQAAHWPPGHAQSAGTCHEQRASQVGQRAADVQRHWAGGRSYP